MYTSGVFEDVHALASIAHTEAVPTSFADACESPQWIESMKEEMYSLNKMNTWSLVISQKMLTLYLPSGCTEPRKMKMEEQLD